MILIPSMGRPHLLKRFFESYMETKATLPGLVMVDENDKSLEDYREMVYPEGWSLVETKAISMGDKVREVWPTLKKADWVGLLNDDHYCVTPEWDTKALAHLDGYNFVSTNDRWCAPRKAAGFTVFSMPLLKAFGFPIFPRNLQHLYIDDVIEQLGRATGCWKVVMNIVVEHRHVLKGEAPVDATHEKVYTQKSWDADQKEFREFMEQDFVKCVERIKSFRREMKRDYL